MNILVTGGAGYIGSHTVLQLLQQGHSVTILDHLNKDKADILDAIRQEAGEFELIKVDLQDLQELRNVLKGKHFDAVIHFAAFIEVGFSTKDPVKFIDNNVIGSQNLTKVLLENDIKNLIFSSSAAVYGTPKSVPIKEDAQLNPENPYGLTKVITEEILESYAQFLDMNVVALRYFNPSGSYKGLIGEKHQPETHVIPLILHTLTDASATFKVFGEDYDTPDGTAIRDYIHVLDLADAHISCIDYLNKNKGFEVFNVGTGDGSSVMEVIKATELITGKKVRYEVTQRRTGDSARLIADPTKIKSKLGWKAKYSLNDIIQSAWDWEQKLLTK